MENIELQKAANWQIMAMFHQSNLNRVKKETGAFHVIHMRDHQNSNGEKVNCIYIKGKEGEIKYGGVKDFSLWDNSDYTNAIKTYKNEFKAS